MKCSFPRRIAAIGSIAAVFAVIVTGAFAAELSPNAASLPSDPRRSLTRTGAPPRDDRNGTPPSEDYLDAPRA